MKYMGSKNRIAKNILPIILKDRTKDQYYIEPFVGGANIIDKVDGKRIGLDLNPYLISLFKGLQENKPLNFNIDKNLYDKARNQYYNEIKGLNSENNFSSFELGWIGFMASANGRFFEGGYSGKSITKSGLTRDYIKESINNILKQKENLIDIDFFNKDYRDFNYPNNSIIYCDIPYKDTKAYSFSKKFNYEEFYDWVRNMNNKGHEIFISEYSMPNDFKIIWEQEVKSSLSANNISGGNKTSIERLFVLK